MRRWNIAAIERLVELNMAIWLQFPICRHFNHCL